MILGLYVERWRERKSKTYGSTTTTLYDHVVLDVRGLMAKTIKVKQEQRNGVSKRKMEVCCCI